MNTIARIHRDADPTAFKVAPLECPPSAIRVRLCTRMLALAGLRMYS